jgi:drug/metabolite transporter (DMT)-like permease
MEHMMSTSTNNKTALLKIILAFVAIYIIWGTTYLAIRMAVATIPAFLMAACRFMTAGTLTYIVLRARGVPSPTWPQWRSTAIIGAFLLMGGNGLVTWSEKQVPSGIAALVVATMPLWMTLFDWLFFQGETPGRQTAVGLFLGFVGIGLLVGPEQLRGTADFDLFSLLVLMVAPILWSIGSLYSRRATLPENVLMTTAMEMLAGGALLLVAGLVTGEAGQFQLSAMSGQSLWALVYLIFFGSIVAYTAYVWLLKMVPPSRVSTYTYVNPIVAVVLGWLILSEPLTPLMLVAMSVIVLAVVLITLQRPKKAASPTAVSASPFLRAKQVTPTD